MAEPRYNFDIRVEYKDGGFESLCVEQQIDAAAAIIKAATMIRRKQRILSVYHNVKSITATLASMHTLNK